MPEKYRLRAEQGPFAGQTFDLDNSVTVGRQEGNELTLADTQLSRKHARFDSGPSGLSVTDLGAANGLFVNGQRIAGTIALRPGDQVGLGASVFRVELAGGAQAASDATQIASSTPAWQQPQAARTPSPAWAQPAAVPPSSAGFPQAHVPPASAPNAAPKRSTLPVVLGVVGVLFLCVCVGVGGLLVVASRGGDSTTAGSGGSSSGGSSSSSGSGGASGGSGAGPTAASFGGGSAGGGGSTGGSGGGGGSTGSGGTSGGSSGSGGGGNTSSRPQPGMVTGRVLTADGRPLPAGATAMVRISGNAIGGQIATYDVRADNQGRYSQRVVEGLYLITARVNFPYNGGVLNLILHPNDDRAPQETHDSKNGVVKDFTWRLSGPILKTGDPRSLDNLYGQQIYIVPNAVKIPPGSRLEVTFTPSGPLADGSTGEALTRTVEGAASIRSALVGDLPLGPYTVSARIIGPQARAVKVCVADSETTCTTNPRSGAAETDFDWNPTGTGLGTVKPSIVLSE